MTSATRMARHRQATKAITPLSELTETAQFGRISVRRAASITAVGAVVGVGLMSSAAGAVISPSPAPQTEPTLDEFTSALEDSSTGTIVSIDQAWDPGDDVGAVAEEPVVEEPVVAQPASRNSTRTSVNKTNVPTPTVDTSSIAAAALSVTGIPYVYGGESLSGMDCSGLVKYVYGQFGISLPHGSGAIGSMGTTIPMSELIPGDIIAYPGHVAIYVGGGQMVEAIDYGYVSRVSDVRGGGWGVRI